MVDGGMSSSRESDGSGAGNTTAARSGGSSSSRDSDGSGAGNTTALAVGRLLHVARLWLRFGRLRWLGCRRRLPRPARASRHKPGAGLWALGAAAYGLRRRGAAATPRRSRRRTGRRCHRGVHRLRSSRLYTRRVTPWKSRRPERPGRSPLCEREGRNRSGCRRCRRKA